MKKVLLTGCAGFIGNETAHQLIQQGYHVIGVDNVNNYYSTELKDHRLQSLNHPNFEFHKEDITNFGAMEKLFDSHHFDCVLNLAAKAGVRASIEDPHDFMATNASGTLNLLQLMIKHEVKKMVLSSTSSLYAGQEMPFKETLAVNQPISPYAASKKAAEMLCHTYSYLYDLDVSIVRYFTVYGPAGRPDMCIFRFIKWIDEQTPIELFGDGSQSRDFTFVGDIAAGTIKAMKPVGFEVINLGGGKRPISLNEVISMIEKKLNKKAIIESKPFHKADIKSTRAAVKKASSLLGWSPTTSFEEGLAKTIDWYIDNKELCSRIEL